MRIESQAAAVIVSGRLTFGDPSPSFDVERGREAGSSASG
jgi:hypothetical protein